MLRHTLILIYRNIVRFKSTFFINLIGLSTGLACVLLIYLWVSDELNVDKFHKKDERLYQVYENTKTSNGITTHDRMPFGLASALVREIPEVEYAATVTPYRWFPKFLVTANSTPVTSEGKFAGADFFKIFSYPLVHGNAHQVLTEKNAIVISEQLARNLFKNSSDAMGKTVQCRLSRLNFDATISGVFENVPMNSSDKFDLVIPDKRLAEIMGFSNPSEDNLGAVGPHTYLTLKPGSNIANLNDKITQLMRTKGLNSGEQSWFVSLYSQNYLFGKFENGIRTGGRITYVKLFSLIALLILFIACINFMNLSTAKASRRIKEIGIKKAVGASRKMLIVQCLCEAMVISFASLFLAFLIVDLLLPKFNEITEKNIRFFFSTELLLSLSVIGVVTGLLAGSYPALYVSGFRPVQALKGKLNASFAELWVRKGLVIFQFAVSVIFIVSILVVFNQIQFVLNKNPGYNKDNVIYFECNGSIASDPNAFTTQLETLPGVKAASSMVSNVITPLEPTLELQINQRKIPINIWRVNYGLLETLGIKMSEGRTFSKNFEDASRMIFNEAAIKEMGIENPIGTIIDFLGERVEIVGVTENFHFRSLYENIKPLAIQLESGPQWNVLVRISPDNMQETITRLETFYKTYNPGFPFEYKFLDQDFQSLYAAEKRVGMLMRYFAGVAIVISCMGLLGLTAFTAERRKKEMGIRKVLGSTEFAIVYLLSKDFTKLVIASIILALPLSY